MISFAAESFSVKRRYSVKIGLRGPFSGFERLDQRQPRRAHDMSDGRLTMAAIMGPQPYDSDKAALPLGSAASHAPNPSKRESART